jgi:nitroreductase
MTKFEFQTALREATTDNGSAAALKFDLARPEDREALRVLWTDGAVESVYDTLDAQLAELLANRHPRIPPNQLDIGQLMGQHPDGAAAHDYGVWVYFPWNCRLVHVLPEADFLELRSLRNRYKILPDDQATLRKKRIGIVGLSVGATVAVTLALEGVGGSFRLADHDTLSLSNMNRLRAAITDIGVNKAVLAARQMLEIDPYLDVDVVQDGISEATAATFVEGLDLLIEECDDLEMKVRLRECARDLGVPVLMETSDRGTLDVERFDIDRNRNFFHGIAGELDARRLHALSRADQVPIVMKILGLDISDSAAASMLEIGETLTTWPQLGSAVMLGGAVVTDTARRILLGTFSASGRFHIDLDTLVADGQHTCQHGTANLDVDVAEEAAIWPAPVRLPAASDDRVPTSDEARYLVEHAVLAPSGGNAQPWQFEVDGNCIRVALDRARLSTMLDFDYLSGYVALGAAVENLNLAASAVGLEITDTVVREGEWLGCDLAITRPTKPRSVDPLHREVHRRVTNRRMGIPQQLTRQERMMLDSALDSTSARLLVIEDRNTINRLGAIVGLGDRLRFLSTVMHQELMAEVRWAASDVTSTRDGLDRATFEMDEATLLGMHLLQRPAVISLLNRVPDGGMAIARRAERIFGQSSAVVLLTHPGRSRQSFFAGGRAMERVWLAATGLGLGLHPQSSLPYLFARFEQGGAKGLTEWEQTTLSDLRDRYRQVFNINEDEAEILLFCLNHVPSPTAHSLRRPPDSFVTFRTRKQDASQLALTRLLG